MSGSPGPGRDGAATTAVVTGGARGIGRALAERLDADGHRVTVLDVLEPEDDATTDWIRCDVTEPDDLAAAMGTVAEQSGGIDVLVNNAGLISPRRPYLESGKEELLRYLTVNAVGGALATQAAHPWLVASDRGCVVNVASRTFFTGSPGQLAYVASKGAVIGMTRVLARELGPHGVTVNAVMPGQVATPGTEQYNAEEDFDRTMAQQAIPRRVRPEDLAGLVSFLCGPDARMVTGQTVVCDGGGYLH
ncbi:SDR family NAD(P)-dependent oxidoreductase [Geodermatophilus sp. CPCC 206100]|uniref:SDR family NAD(P)-dependent oxidoreductase n=1 Tax=Geodermatophilus sp. CPCC 206100 TaxID=3020054 RepID=UPI003B00BA98